MDKLILFTLNRTAQTTVLTERQRDKLMIKILLAALQKYMKKEKRKNKYDETGFWRNQNEKH